MTPQEILAEVIGILLGGLGEVATEMGSALSEFVQAIAFTTTTGEGGVVTQELSAFFVIVLIFWAITLALGLFRFILNVITSAGNRAR